MLALYTQALELQYHGQAAAAGVMQKMSAMFNSPLDPNTGWVAGWVFRVLGFLGL